MPFKLVNPLISECTSKLRNVIQIPNNDTIKQENRSNGPATNVFKSRADKSPMDDSFFSEEPIIRRKINRRASASRKSSEDNNGSGAAIFLNKKKDEINNIKDSAVAFSKHQTSHITMSK